VAVLANASILLLVAWQWVILLPGAGWVRFPSMLWITAVTSTVSNGGPFMAGHAAGVHLLATRGEVGYATAVSVKALDQLTEGIAKLLLFAATIAMSPLSSELRWGVAGLLAGVSVLGVLLLGAAHRGHLLKDLAAHWPGWPGRVLEFLSRAAADLEALRRPHVYLFAVALGGGKKLAEGLGILAVLMALGVAVPAWGLLLVLSAVNFSTMASVTPANVGIYEASAVVAYGVVGLDTDLAVGIAVLQHIAYLVPMAGAGLLALLGTHETLGAVTRVQSGQPSGPTD
jgi:uncharacterized membrane protein YbhN (UPF0104 family)